MKKANLSKDKTLRQIAEELLQNKTSKAKTLKSESDTLKLIHELEVHQIELELQNEELLLARSEAIEALDNYTQLYDFAPAGYFSLSTGGEILELNFTGAKMLDKERLYLINSKFGFLFQIIRNPHSAFFWKKFSKARAKKAVKLSFQQIKITRNVFTSPE